jgi:hypothetical protein
MGGRRATDAAAGGTQGERPETFHRHPAPRHGQDRRYHPNRIRRHAAGTVSRASAVEFVCAVGDRGRGSECPDNGDLAAFPAVIGRHLSAQGGPRDSPLSDKKKALEIARGIETEIGRYLVTVSIINLVLGVAASLLMYLLHMPNPMLWGAMVALLNFIPYVGATISLSILTVVAILTFETLGQALAVPAGFLVLTTLEGQIGYPFIVGRHFSVNPVLVFVSLLFWGLLWGIPGMLMAVPILVIAKIICSHIESLAVVKEFLEA